MTLTADQLYALAYTHFNAGRLEQAIPFLETLVPHSVVGPDAQNLLGVIRAQQGDLERSVACLAELARAHPLNPDYHANLVTTLERAGNMSSAIEAARDWAGSLYKSKRWSEAEDVLRRILMLDPVNLLARCNLAATCEALGRPCEAIEIGLSLLRLLDSGDPGTIELVGDIEAILPRMAPEAGRRMPANPRDGHVSPDSKDREELLPKVLCNLGNSLLRLRQCELSLHAYRRSMALAPVPLTEWNLALALLLIGRFEEGWQAYESRWRWDEFEFPDRGFVQPRWQGESLDGRSILVYAEQGYGDTIQFCRFVPHLLEQTPHVTFEVQRELFPLLRSSFSDLDIRLIPRDKDPRMLAEPVRFDVHCGLMSLFHSLGLKMSAMKTPIAYLSPNSKVREEWASRLPSSSVPRVGIVWAGRPEHHKDSERSILNMEILKPLAELAPDMEWHSLQTGSAASLRSAFSSSCVDHVDELTDFEQTAGLIERLDAIVAVDTAVAHLASAMGKTVFLLLPYVPDWRWQLDRDDSPWYSNCRLFRQTERGDWTAPVLAAAKDMASKFRNGQD